jgi:hypothetical protein
MMKMLKAAATLAAAALLAGGCGGSVPGRAPARGHGPGPLPAMPEGGPCGESPGTLATLMFYIAQNTTSSPLRITGASLTGTRNVTVNGVWADLLPPGAVAIGSVGGYPPASWRHPVAIIVPAGASFEVLFTVTTGRSALVTGERVSYTWRGRSYSVTGQRFLGIPPGMHC